MALGLRFLWTNSLIRYGPMAGIGSAAHSILGISTNSLSGRYNNSILRKLTHLISGKSTHSIFRGGRQPWLLRNSFMPQLQQLIPMRRVHNGQTEDLNVKWLWKTGDVIAQYNEGNIHGTRSLFYRGSFKSDTPLETHHFQKAFQHLLSQHPNLRTVIRKREGISWYCQYPEYKIDFKTFVDEENFREDYFNVIDNGFQDSDTLPWRARVLDKSLDMPFSIDKVKETHPYQYYFAFIFNHALGDGIEYCMVFSSLTEGLECAVGGVPLYKKDIGIFEDNQDLEVLLKQREETLLKDPRKIDMIKRTLPMEDEPPIVQQAFTRPKVPKPTTKHLFKQIEPEVMKAVFFKCRQMGVTYNSFTMALCNVALSELMQEAGTIRDTYELRSLLFVDSRRFKSQKKHLHGCHVLPLTYKTQVASNARHSFWNYCHLVDLELHVCFSDDGLVLDQAVVREMLQPKSYNYTDNPRPVLHDYSNSFVGNIVDKAIAFEGKHVIMTDLNGFQTIQNYHNAFVQEIFNFRGNHHYNFSYASNYFSDTIVNLLAERIFQLMEIVSK